MSTHSVTEATIESTLLALVTRRAPGSICPSEVARALADGAEDWRELMPGVRAVAVRLAQEGVVGITRAGRTLSPDAIDGGPIRISLRDRSGH